MRVLLTSTDNPYVRKIGGKHVHLLLLERGLKHLGVDISTNYYDPRNFFEAIKKYATLVLPREDRFKIKLDSMESYLKNHMHDRAFDIVHAHDAPSFNATFSGDEGNVLTLHGYFAKESVDYLKNASERTRDKIYSICHEMERKAAKDAARIITVDSRIQNYVVTEFGYDPSRITVIYNAVDTDLFHPISPEEQKKIKMALGFGEDAFLILVPRRLVKKNGVIHAVRAMKSLRDHRIKMIIAGDGPEKRNILEEARTDERIMLLGVVPHERIERYFASSDVVLVPSVTSSDIQEATSLSMLEGMSSAKPVVCSNVGGMAEVVNDMKNGLLTKEGDPDDMAKAIELVIENKALAAELGRRAREYVLRNHSYIAHTEKVARVYDEVLRG